MNRRVVVTGQGAVTPLGVGTEKSWQALCAGQSGVGWVNRFDASGFRTRVAGEVRDFRPEDFMSDKLARRTDRYQQFALAAASLALKEADLKITPVIADRVGASIGTGFGGFETMVKGQIQFMNGSRNDISPFFVPMLITGMAAGQVAMMFGAKGPNFSSTTACAAGTHAVGDAFRIIQRGEADVMFAGGAEAPVVPVVFHSLGIMGATTGRADDPAKACRPFDNARDGFVPSEGAGILILEELEFALRRDARIYGEVVGYAATADAYHVTSPSPGGEGAMRCMRLALEDAGLKPEQVDYINAHGTSTKINDITETQAIKTVFGPRAYQIPISSNKSMLGHTLGASGALEAIFTLLTMDRGVIPPTTNLDNPDPDCDLDYVPNVARQGTTSIAVSNSFGFGGTNGVLVLRRYEGQ
ncbi:MAG TPA: beta-ketoacyl-ACP synthase II [Dehalococcoidia bacterium]|nr:beta-ketoacyl-ACP synthase II [Dehalococcoidia bacterium]